MGGRGGNSGMGGGGGASTVDKTGFVNEGSGQWTLDTPYGGGSILDESDSSAGGYGEMTVYSARAWDANYNMIGDVQMFGSLNAAKSAIRDKIKSTIK